MGSISAEASAAVARRYDVAPFRRIVDVGGSQGVLLAGLLPAAPSATGVRFDLPKVVNGAREVLAASGQANRVELAGGDFFEQVPRRRRSVPAEVDPPRLARRMCAADPAQHPPRPSARRPGSR